MQTGMNSAFGVAIQGKIFVCDRFCDCAVYEVSTNEWQTMASLRKWKVDSRFRLRSVVSLNQTLHAVGTVGANFSLKPDEMIVVKSYDPKLIKWIQKTSIPINKSSDEETYSFQCATLKLSKGLLYRSKIMKIDT